MKNVLILGTGRSGTSMLAGTLAGAGYYMGTDYIPRRAANPKGFFEGREINDLNEDILAPFMHWAKPVRLLTWSFRTNVPGRSQMWLARIGLEETVAGSPRIERKVKELVSHEPYCFKDPRFSYTLPVWLPYLHNAVLLCIFRDPAETANSILRECQEARYLHSLEIDRALALENWRLMYSHILERHVHEGDWMFVHYQQLFEKEMQERVGAFTGADIQGGFPDKSLRRSQSDPDYPPDIAAIYARLCDLAGFHP